MEALSEKESETSTFKIRKYSDKDYPAVISLWQEARLPLKPRGRDRRDKMKTQAGQPNVCFILAEDHGKLMGTVVGTHDSRKGWINRLAVAPAYQGQGIARRLVEEVERWLSQLGIEIIACLIEEENPISMRVFEKFGYKRHSEIIYFAKRKSEET
jgi:ribosomal protein S18 acetylase RimI-like enzyme